MLLPLTPLRFLHRAAGEFGGKTGVVCGESRFTYLEFADRVHRLTGALKKGGIGPGDRVAFLSFNCHRLLEAYYGAPQAGAILLPLNVRLAPEEQGAILNHSGARAVFFALEFLPAVEKFRQSAPGVQWYVPLDPCPAGAWADRRSYDELVAGAAPGPADYRPVDENSIAEIFYTSGSTGRPKGVMLSHRTLYLHALYVLAGLGANEAGVELHTIPLFHANGWGRAHTPTFIGARHVMCKRFDPQWVLETIQRERVTTFSMVPTMATALIHFPGLRQYDLSSLHFVNLGGAPSAPALVKAVEQALGCRAYAGYGLTETSPVLCTAQVKNGLAGLPDDERIQRQAMTGFPIPGVEMRVVDAEGRDVARDLAAIGERVLASHPAVYESAVVGVPDQKWGEVPKAFVSLQPGAAATEAELKDFVRQRLAGFKVPKSVEFLDALPKGSTGKILKRSLRDPYWAGMEKRVHG